MDELVKDAEKLEADTAWLNGANWDENKLKMEY